MLREPDAVVKGNILVPHSMLHWVGGAVCRIYGYVWEVVIGIWHLDVCILGLLFFPRIALVASVIIILLA